MLSAIEHVPVGSKLSQVVCDIRTLPVCAEDYLEEEQLEEHPAMAQTEDSREMQQPPATGATIPSSDLLRLQAYLNLPTTGHLSSPNSTPLAFLAAYFDLIPSSLTHVFSESTTPQQRSRIRQVKARRMIWAGLGTSGVATQPGGSVSNDGNRSLGGKDRPLQLSAEEGWKRFPLLWERLGGDPLGPPKSFTAQAEEQRIPRDPQRDDLISILSTNRPPSNAKPEPKFSQGGLFGAMDDDEGEVSSMSSIPLPSVSIATRSTGPSDPPTTAAQPPLPAQPISRRVHDEGQWPTHSFMPGSERSSVLKVNRLGSLMRDLEEEREAIEVVEARRRERRDNVIAERRARERLGGLDAADGEDEEVGEGGKTQQEVIEAFERQLLELFLDGMDAIPYEEIDFTEPAEGNPLLEQDAQDDYFDDEEEFDYRAARGDAPAEEDKLAEGEYDY